MMKKNKTSSVFNTINEILTIARDRGIIHLTTEDEKYDGRIITIKGNKLINFGSCSYLGLETDQRLKEASIDAVRRYGAQFSSSRTYCSFTLYEQLEELIARMFNVKNVLLSTCTTLGHQAVIPIAVDDSDAVILDQQVHYSMQDPVNHLQLRGVTVTKVRHSRLDELQQKIAELSVNHEKVWYFVDGVYSMYGDLAPMEELMQLLNKNKKLHLYVDDAHGMSWAGENGTGAVLSQVKMHPRMILATSLAKAFGSAGGVFLIPDEELFWKVKNWGGPLTHSGPQQPAVVGASVASAKIHLADEIYQRQLELSEKVLYCNKIFQDLNLPLVGDSISPIFFVGLGLTKVGYNMVRRLADDGLHVNLGIFPAVPETCTGIRFTVNLNHSNEDLEKLAERTAFHLPRALQEEERSMGDIYRAFKQLKKFKTGSLEISGAPHSKLTVQYETSIHRISPNLWNELLGGNGAFDHAALVVLENSYNNNPKKEDNCSFHYYIIRDEFNMPLVATFFTEALIKDDMLSPGEVSKAIELQRETDHYYLTSKALMMGTLITEGQHYYINKKSSAWKTGVMYLLDLVWKLQEQCGADALLLRDFDACDVELREFLTDQGFVKIDMPESYVVDLDWNEEEDYIASLPSRRRYHLKKNVLEYQEAFDVEIPLNPGSDMIEKWYQLYCNVSEKNYDVNTYKVPKKLFYEAAASSNWEFIQLRSRQTKEIVSVMLNNKSSNYVFVLIGMDYKYLEELKIYKQSLFQLVVRSMSLNAGKLFLGLTTGFEKRKVGARAEDKVGFIQLKDDYHMSLINLIPNLKAEKK